jgi:hypothetical protein
MADAPSTGTHERVSNLESDVRDMRDHVQTIQLDLGAMCGDVAHIKASIENSSREATTYRRETRHDIKCITDTWSSFQKEFGPMLSDLREKRDESKALRKHVRFAWMTAAGLAVGGAFITWADAKWKAIAALLTKVQ